MMKPQVNHLHLNLHLITPVPGKIGDKSPLTNSAGLENPKIVTEKPERCDKCGARYKNKHSLSNHIYGAHGGKNGGQRGKKCEECDTEFDTLNHFFRHSEFLLHFKCEQILVESG